MFSSVSRNCCLRASPSGSRSGGEEVSPPPPRVMFVYSGSVSAASRNHIDVLVTGETIRAACYIRILGRTGACFCCRSDSLSEAKTGPLQKVTKEHADRRAVGLPGAFKLRNDKLVERVV
jgi:hypothetical protein